MQYEVLRRNIVVETAGCCEVADASPDLVSSIRVLLNQAQQQLSVLGVWKDHVAVVRES
jgi:hypothetical protein